MRARNSITGTAVFVLVVALPMALATASGSKQPTPQPPQHFDPPQRDLWSRGSQRFQRQWLVAAPVGAGRVPSIATATEPPGPGQPVAPDLQNARWIPNTSYSDTVDLGSTLPMAVEADQVAIAYAAVTRDEAGEADLLLGADGAFDLWVNGEQVLSRAAPSRFVPDGERVRIKLRQGPNAVHIAIRGPLAAPTRFALRVVPTGAITPPYQELVPAITASDGTQVTIQTHAVKEAGAAPVEIAAIAAGGVIVAERTAARGDSVVLDTTAWRDGPYDLRLSTRDAWGKRKVTYLPWYKGNVEAAVRELQQAATAAPKDARGATVRMLAEMVANRQQTRSGADLAAQLQSPLMEFAELDTNVRAGGFVRLAYIDDIDGSAQFCRAYLPLEYTTSQRWPLVMFLHGFNPANPPYPQWWSADQRHSVIADEHATIYVEPHGRGNAQYAGIGERDVLRCLELAKQRFKVDEDRVYLTGESMGGHGTWLIASRHPELFAAAAPVFGGWDFRVAAPGGAPSTLPPPDNARAAFQHEQASSFSGAEGLLNVPLLITHGDADAEVPVELSRHATRMLQRWDYDVRYNEMPGYGHDDLGQRENIIDWLLTHRRNPAPRHVSLRAVSLDAASAHWVKVTAFVEPLRVMRADAEVIRPGLIRIDTENVAALSLTPASALRGNGDDVTVVWNGKSQEIKAVDGVINLAQSNITSRTLRKRPELPGLLSDVVNTPFAVVVGTTSTDAQMRKHCAQKADAFAQLWQQWQHQPLRLFKDTEISAADQENYSLILIGGADSNAISRKLSKLIPLKVSADAVTIDGRRFATKDAVVQMIYPNPLNARRYVMVVAGTSAAGMYFWKPPVVHPALGYAILPFDWLIADGRTQSAAQRADRDDLLVAAGVFDAQWKIADDSTVVGRQELRSRLTLRQAPPAGWKVPQASLQANAGLYQVAPGFYVEVINTGDSLAVSIPGQAPVPLIAESDTSFSNALTGAPVRFVRDEQGRIASAEADNFGVLLVAPRLRR